MNPVLISIILIPILEIYLFIKIGAFIGAFNTIALIFITAFLGIVYARYEGLNTLRSGFSQIIKSTMLKTIFALKLISSRLPIGVETMYKPFSRFFIIFIFIYLVSCAPVNNNKAKQVLIKNYTKETNQNLDINQ